MTAKNSCKRIVVTGVLLTIPLFFLSSCLGPCPWRSASDSELEGGRVRAGGIAKIITTRYIFSKNDSGEYEKRLIGKSSYSYGRNGSLDYESHEGEKFPKSIFSLRDDRGNPNREAEQKIFSGLDETKNIVRKFEKDRLCEMTWYYIDGGKLVSRLDEIGQEIGEAQYRTNGDLEWKFTYKYIYDKNGNNANVVEETKYKGEDSKEVPEWERTWEYTFFQTK